MFKNAKLKKLLLLAANFYFYAYFDYRFLALLFCATTVTFFIGSLLQKTHPVFYRKALLLSGLAINTSILIVFKYYNFFIESLGWLFGLNQDTFSSLNILIPLGVSFYTFRFISYLVDIFKATNNSNSCNFIDFLIYGTFFPIIISGPISRASNFLPQLVKLDFSVYNLYAGYRRFVIGLFLKVFIADRIAQYVNFVFENHEVFNSVSIWLATFAYSLQIYCDFAGYSSMAIGLSLILLCHIRMQHNILKYLS
jgi:alginate O-acetyltransferase complex protein AlgI